MNKPWKNITFTILTFLVFFVGLASGSFYYVLWLIPSVQETFGDKVGDLYGEKFWFFL